MVTLRTPNNPNTDLTVMAAMARVLVGTPTQNTTVPYGSVYIHQDDVIQLPTTTFPLVHLEAGAQEYQRIGEEYAGTLDVTLTYYDRWDTQRVSISAVWATIASDLERIMANLQSNDALAVGNASHTTSVARMRPSPYKGTVDNMTVPGMTLVSRHVDITYNVLPFDA